MRRAMLVDTSFCVGCKACQTACKQWWNLPGEPARQDGRYENPADLGPGTLTRVRYHEREGDAGLRWLFLNWGCMHCTEAACVEVCPAGALRHAPDGPVTLDRATCNGCGYCVEVCPFGIPRLEVHSVFTGRARAAKCTFCTDRVRNGLEPACAQSCPTGAIHFGERAVLLDRAGARLERLRGRGCEEARLYGERELGGLGRMYVLTAAPQAYGLPERPAYPGLLRAWQRVIQPFGSLAMAATAVGLGANWLAARRAHLSRFEVLPPGREGD